MARGCFVWAAAILAISGSSHAASQYFSWDPARTTWSGNTWGIVSGGPYTNPWGGYDEAVFESTGGRVTGGGAVNKWTFNADGYTLAGSFIMGSPAAANLIVPNVAHTATINGGLSYANTGNILWKDGAGKLVLGGNNTTYHLFVEQGTLETQAGSTTVVGDLHVGRDSFGAATPKLGTLVVSGGNLTVNGASFMMGQTVNGTSKVAQLTQTGGAVTFNGSFMGIANGGGVSQLDLSGGSFTSAATLALGVRNIATLNLGGAEVNVPEVRIFWSDAVTGSGKTGTVNLEGGTLTTGRIWQASAANTGIVNFNGGTLKARSSNAGFLGGLTAAKVKAGGANIDSDSFEITIGQPLVEDALSTGGGLVKSGTGVLALNGANTYTGPTSVNVGTLLINGSLSAATPVNVAAGAALGGSGTVGGPVSSLGNIVPGDTGIGTLTTGPASLTAASYLCQIQGSGADRWKVTGDLVLTDAALRIEKLGTATFTTAVIVSYTGTLTGDFTIVPPLPAGIRVHHDEANKQICLIKAGDYDTWLEGFSFASGADTSAGADADGDGLTNEQEYAFGLDPADPSSNQPMVYLPDRATGTFSCHRRDPALTGMGHKVWTSPDLIHWTEDAGAIEVVTKNAGDNQEVRVYLSRPVPLAEPTLFVRCTATQGAGAPLPPVVSSTAISSSHHLPVVGQAVQIGLPSGGAGLCLITDPGGAVSRLDIPASGVATWQPARYGRHVLQCPGHVRNLWVMATPMYFSWWDVRWSPGIENATAVMAIPEGAKTEWQRRGVKLVNWVVGEYAHRTGVGYNPPYSLADQWVQDWLRAKALPQHQLNSGFALDEVFCSSGAPSPAIAEAIDQFRRQVGPDYFMSVYTAGAETSFGPYAHFLRDSKALCMIESYYGDEALFATRWNDMKNHGLASQSVFAIGCGFRLNPTTHGPLTPQEARDEFAKVRRVAPESPGITLYGGFSEADRTTIQPAIDAACSQAIEDYFLKPVIHLTGGKAQVVCWNIGNDDADGFVIEWHGSAGKLGEQTLPKITPQQKLTIPSIPGTTKAVVRPAAGGVNIQPAGVTITP